MRAISDLQGLIYNLIRARPTPPPSDRESTIHTGLTPSSNRLFERPA
jgi:hypothetical protein